MIALGSSEPPKELSRVEGVALSLAREAVLVVDTGNLGEDDPEANAFMRHKAIMRDVDGLLNHWVLCCQHGRPSG